MDKQQDEVPAPSVDAHKEPPPTRITQIARGMLESEYASLENPPKLSWMLSEGSNTPQ